MAFFNLRKGGKGGKARKSVDEAAASSRQPESVEAMRRRARHRLIGAGVLVLLGVIGFPLLFDTQPRPIAVDIPIEIPDRNKVKPLPAQQATAPAPSRVASPPAAQAPVASTAVAAAPAAKAEPPPEAKVEPKAESRPEKPEPKAAAKPETKPESKPEAKPGDAARAQALLEGKPVTTASAAAEGRFIVQVGAFSDTAKMRETRSRLERSGIKTYTHVAETKDGKLTRVRVGPFASRAEADQAARKIKALDLDPHILKL